MTLYGRVMFHSETGTEGGYWAFQDDRGVRKGPSPRWSYDGQFILHNGDHVKVYGEDGQVVFDGDIDLREHELFSEDAGGYWIHADQIGVERDWWANLFFMEFRAELTLADPEQHTAQLERLEKGADFGD